MTEAAFQKKVLKRLREVQGLWFVKLCDRFTAGLPDIILCYQGQPGAMELKTSTGELTTLQSLTLARMKFAGYVTTVARSMFDVESFLEVLCKKRG